MLTYKQAYDRLTEAYIAGKVEPFNPCSCFIGNLLLTDNWMELRNGWSECKVNKGRNPLFINYENYTNIEIVRMEHIFMKEYVMNHPTGKGKNFSTLIMYYSGEDYVINRMANSGIDEEALFKAFCVALDELREIHLSKGEDLEEVPVFKRRLQTNL